MIAIYLLVAFQVILLNLAFKSPQCNGVRYKCGTDNKEKICVNVSDYQGKIHDLQICPSGYYCPYAGAEFGKPVVCAKSASKNLTLPGEICTSSSDCMSGTCEKGSCKGKQIGEACKWHGDCDVGTFCNSTSICETQRAFEATCSNDFQCQNNCVCSNKKCAFYYSLQNNLSASNPSSEACSSGYVSRVNDTCQKGPHSEVKARPCTTDGDCILLDDDGRLAGYSTCSCGFNAGSFSYCHLSEGDQEYQDTILLFQWVLYTNHQCHTSLRYGPCRYLYDEEVVNYQKAVQFYQMQPLIKYNDDCIKAIYTPQYWEIGSTMIWGVVAVVITLLQ